MEHKNRKAIIIGANGYIGRHLALLLLNGKRDVELYDTGPEPTDPSFGAFYRQLDVRKRDAFDQLDPGAGMVFMMAGLTGTKVGFKEYRNFVEVNELGLLNLLDWFSESGAGGRLVFPSSRLVYKGIRNVPLREDDTLESKTVYASNKLACESYLQMYHNTRGIQYTVYRICVPYGSLFGDYPYGTIGFLLNRGRSGQPITLFGDGSQRRTFTHVEDIARILAQTDRYTDLANDIFNLGGANHLSILKVAQLIAEIYDVPITHTEWPAQDLAIESGDTVFNSEKLDRIIGYSYRQDLLEWIRNLERRS